MPVTRAQITWLRLLVASYRTDHRWDDPSADHDEAREMLHECTLLADELERQLPPEPPATGATGDEIPW